MSAEATVAQEFRVAVFDRVGDPHVLCEVLQRVLGLNHTDAMIWSRRIPAILNGKYSQAQASELASAIQQLGVRASVIPEKDVPELRHAQVVHHVQCVPGGLQVLGLQGEADELIPWSAMRMVCVGEVPLDVSHHYSSGDWNTVTAGHHPQTSAITLPHTPGLEVIITCSQPFPSLKIDHEQMNYEYLGTRKVDSATTNFKLLVEDLARYATSALMTESTDAFLKHVQPERYRFHNREDFLSYATLQSLLGAESVSSNIPA